MIIEEFIRFFTRKNRTDSYKSDSSNDTNSTNSSLASYYLNESGSSDRDGTEDRPARGIEGLYEPDQFDADVVVIHGLKGPREGTWMVKDATETWLETLLAKDIPNIRLLAFGYDSSSVQSLNALISLNRIKSYASELLEELSKYREKSNTNNKPVIFVAHGLGGLVCELSLLPEEHGDEIQATKKSIRGIVYFGTPHGLGGLAEWAQLQGKLLGVKSNTQVIKELEDELRRVRNAQQASSKIAIERGLKIICCFEQVPMADGCLSAEWAILPSSRAIAINKDHLGMTKFTDPNDPSYESMKGEFINWTRDFQDKNRTESDPFKDPGGAGLDEDTSVRSSAPSIPA